MEPLVRASVLTSYVDLVHSLHGDPRALIRRAALDPTALATPGSWLPAARVSKLLEDTAASLGCPDFGLRLAGLHRLSNLGPLGLVIREEPTVGSALGVLIRHLHLHNEMIRLQLSQANGLATLRVELDAGAPGNLSQATDLCVGVGCRIVQYLLTSDWRPVGASFTHPEPVDITTYHAQLGPQVTFGQSFSGLTFYATDLEAPNTMASAEFSQHAQQLLQTIDPPQGATLTGQVRQTIEALLPSGRCSIQQVARTFAVDARTVQRRLAEDGDSYSEVLDSVRVSMARRYVEGSDRPLTQVAELLGFSAPGTFSRWFTGRFGMSPSAWRKNPAGARKAGV